MKILLKRNFIISESSSAITKSVSRQSRHHQLCALVAAFASHEASELPQRQSLPKLPLYRPPIDRLPALALRAQGEHRLILRKLTQSSHTLGLRRRLSYSKRFFGGLVVVQSAFVVELRVRPAFATKLPC
ncbi:hypothetical protein [Rhizobium sp. CF122]|uniref:hypothetical protein n=1 Tax=Rhizobium sp. CF122 TaxID=1144312 RepID=UPI000565F859|nr:hypothetical protein [Rhizobium sp. CF122]